MESKELAALQSAVPGIQFALEDIGSDDLFRQLIGIDAALLALETGGDGLTQGLEALDIQDEATEAAESQNNGQEVSTWRERLEGLQTAVRHAFNERARPSLQGLGIADLPNELLLKIFDEFKGKDGHAGFNEWWNIKVIQNVRLTCRPLCDAISHLLLRRVTISISTSSLEHLEEVTRHPTVSKGIGLFKLDPAHYRAAVAEDPQRYWTMCHDRVQPEAKSYEETYEREKEEEREKQEEHEKEEEREGNTVEDTVMHSRRLLSALEVLRRGDDPGDGEGPPDAATLALRRAHDRYRQLFREQREALQGGRFVQAVAAAVARCHPSVTLEVVEHAHRPLNNFHRWEDIAPNEDLLVDFLSPVQTWARAENGQAGEPQQSILYELPLAMHAAGATLVGYTVQMSAPLRFSLGMSEDQLRGLRELARDLTEVDFRLSRLASDKRDSDARDPDLKRSPDEKEGLFTFLSALLASGNLRDFCLDFSGADEELSPEKSGIGPLLTSTTWKNLKSMGISHISIHLHELKEFMGMLEVQAGIHMNYVYLISGTWADALDCMHERQSCEDWFNTYIEVPLGAECEDMNDDLYFALFAGFFGPGSSFDRANLYINSYPGFEKNPIRIVDEGTESDDEEAEATPSP